MQDNDPLDDDLHKVVKEAISLGLPKSTFEAIIAAEPNKDERDSAVSRKNICSWIRLIVV